MTQNVEWFPIDRYKDLSARGSQMRYEVNTSLPATSMGTAIERTAAGMTKPPLGMGAITKAYQRL